VVYRIRLECDIVQYGCQSWTIKPAASRRLKAFKIDMYQKMMQIIWTKHSTNNQTSHDSASVVRTTFKVYGKRQNLTLSQPKKP